MFTLHAQAHNQVSFSARIHGFTDSQLASADEMYDEYGPTPRICIDFVYNPDISVQYRNLYTEATHGDLVEKSFDLISDGRVSDLDEPSQTICLIRRNQDEEDNLVHPSLDFITPTVRTKVKRQLMGLISHGGASRFI